MSRCQQCAVADQLQCVRDEGHEGECVYAEWPYRNAENLPVNWPRAKDPANGWKLDFKFLHRIKRAVSNEWDVGEEEIEAVLLAALVQAALKADRT